MLAFFLRSFGSIWLFCAYPGCIDGPAPPCACSVTGPCLAHAWTGAGRRPSTLGGAELSLTARAGRAARLMNQSHFSGGGRGNILVLPSTEVYQSGLSSHHEARTRYTTRIRNYPADPRKRLASLARKSVGRLTSMWRRACP